MKSNSNQIQIKGLGTGRRKSSIAVAQLKIGNGQFIINNILANQYMQNNTARLSIIEAPLNFLQLKKKFNIQITVKGGGIVSQAEAIKLAISKAVSHLKLTYKQSLRLKGFLTTDSRVKERKKYGLKKARKAKQFSKR